METFLLILMPFFSAIILFFIKSTAAKRIAVPLSLIPFFYSLFLYTQFDPKGDFQFIYEHAWLPDMGISFKIGLDGINLLMVLLTNLLIPVIMFSIYSDDKKGSYFGLIFLMQAALIGVFVSLDAFVYYLFWEMTLIPSYFLLLLWGDKNETGITLKFFVYTLAGSLFMLLGIILIYFQTKEKSFDITAFYGLNISNNYQIVIFWLLFIAYAIKIPIFPFHTWQADTYREAPTAATMLFSGILLKMGLFSIIRWMLPTIPQGVHSSAPIVMVLCVIGIIYGSWIAFQQKNIKTILAYSSFAHVGLITAGIFTLNIQGLQGGLFQMFVHGINVVGLFAVAEIIGNRTSTNNVEKLGGLKSVAPVFATCFLIILLGSIALPLTNGFIGEFIILTGIFKYNTLLSVFAGTTIILSAVYMLRLYQKVALGETVIYSEGFSELRMNEAFVLIPICLLVFILGVYPQPILDLTEPSVTRIIQIILKK
jgi:NADH-quinone oxidoreductase subunit M